MESCYLQFLAGQALRADETVGGAPLLAHRGTVSTKPRPGSLSLPLLRSMEEVYSVDKLTVVGLDCGYRQDGVSNADVFGLKARGN